MSSPTDHFRTAVNKATSRDERADAIDALADAGECDKLGIVVQTSGLAGPLRRRALNGLARADCDDLLRTLVEHDRIEDDLREDAAALLDG